MTNRDFGQLVLGTEVPTLEQRENVVRNGLRDWVYERGYVRVHAVKATSKSAVYAAVSYEAQGTRFLTYAVASLRCRRKGDGHWLDAEVFLTNASTPFNMTDCPDEIFEAGAATGLPAKIDTSWHSSCLQSKKMRENAQAFKKGQIFKLDPSSPSTLIAGEPATYAVVLGKKTARLIAPTACKTKEGPTSELLQHYSPVPSQQVATFSDLNRYTEVGELLFDLSGAAPVLKGRLAVGAKATLLAKAKDEIDRQFKSAFDQFNFASKFTSGAWLS